MNYELFNHQDKKIYLINMLREENQIFSELFEKGVEKYLRAGKKIWILINKKGHTWGTICHSCGHIPQCENCSVAINYYLLPSGQKMGLCHICKRQYLYPQACAQCGSSKIKEFGMGTQKLAQLLKERFWAESLIVESETVRSQKKIEKLTSELDTLKSQSKNPIIIWTSLLTTPIKNWKFDLLIFLNADIGLNIPDFNANEKNFYFLYEAFVKHQCPTFWYKRWILSIIVSEWLARCKNQIFMLLKMNSVRLIIILLMENFAWSCTRMRLRKSFLQK